MRKLLLSTVLALAFAGGVYTVPAFAQAPSPDAGATASASKLREIDRNNAESEVDKSASPVFMLVVGKGCATCDSTEDTLARAAAQFPDYKFVKADRTLIRGVYDVQLPVLMEFTPGEGGLTVRENNFNPTDQSAAKFLKDRSGWIAQELEAGKTLAAATASASDAAKPLADKLTGLKDAVTAFEGKSSEQRREINTRRNEALKSVYAESQKSNEEFRSKLHAIKGKQARDKATQDHDAVLQALDRQRADAETPFRKELQDFDQSQRTAYQVLVSEYRSAEGAYYSALLTDDVEAARTKLKILTLQDQLAATLAHQSPSR